MSLRLSHAFYSVKNIDTVYIIFVCFMYYDCQLNVHLKDLITFCVFMLANSLDIFNSIPISASYDALHVKEYSSKPLQPGHLENLTNRT